MSTESKFESISIAGMTWQPLNSLRGFEKGRHSIPKVLDERTVRFVAAIAAQDVKQDLEFIFQKLKQHFKFKRKEVQVTTPEGGCGTIQTPYFSYSVQASPSQVDPASVCWERSVVKIGSSEKVLSAEFAAVFDYMFDRVEFCFDQPLDIEQWIDGIEDRDDSKLKLTYDSQLTECLLQIENLNAEIKINREKVTVVHSQIDQATNILKSFLEAREAISIGLPNSQLDV